MTDETLLDARILKRLESYQLVRQRPVPGRPGGIQRSVQKGGAVEFADYREYTLGDELRRVDWKAYARLRRLYVKEFLDERQHTTLFLIDGSASMDWGGAEVHKGRYALRIAAGLGTCALAGNDRLVVILTGGKENLAGKLNGEGEINFQGLGGFKEFKGSKKEELPEQISLSKGKSTFEQETRGKIFPELKSQTALPKLWNLLKTVSFGGSAGLAPGFQNAFRLIPGAKSLYVFSDLYDLPAVEEMLCLAAGKGVTVTLLHILSPEERTPAGEGEYLLTDAETGTRLEITFNPAVYNAYSRCLEAFYQELDNSCRRWGAKRVLLDSGEAVADTFFKTLPRAGVLKPKG